MVSPGVRRALLLCFLIPLTLGVARATEQAGAHGAQPAPPVQIDWAKLPAHPRLFADAPTLAAAKAKTDEVSKEIRDLIEAQANKALLAEDIIYPTVGMNFEAMREAQKRILPLAFEYRLTGDRRYFEQARYELLKLAALRSWNPSHFLDVGEAAFAAGVGYDWLYDELSKQDRDLVRHAIVTNALLPSLKVQEGGNSWVAGNFNWNQVCNGGLTVAALAIADREPDLARRIVERAVRNIPKAGAVYAPDGSYPEGPSYWLYGTTYHVFCAEALRTALGSTYGLDRLPGFLESAEFKRQMVAPSGAEYNFSDYHDEREEEPVLLWYARHLKDRGVAAQEFDKLQALHADGTKQQGPYFVVSRHLVFALLWWDPQLPPGGKPEPLHWTAVGELPIATMRSGRDDPNAAYLAIKGGTPNHSHAHMDVGSFIFEAGGVRWALDLGTEDYGKMRAGNLTLWDYSQGSSRWNTFRVGPEAHNILRFNQQQQNIHGKGEIAALPGRNGAMRNIVDLRSLYLGQAEDVRRTVELSTNKFLTIRDEWKAMDYVTNVSWQWLTRASVTVTTDGFILEQDGKKLRLRATSKNAPTFSVQDISQPHAIYDSANPGVSRLIINLTTAAGASDFLTVHAALF